MKIEFSKTEEYLISDEIVVVDPSYVLEEQWKTIEELIFSTKLMTSGIMQIEDSEFFIFATEDEGTYIVKKHNKVVDEISVDSGYIAIFKKSEFEKISDDYDCVVEVDFPEKILIEYESGTVNGPLTITSEYQLEEDEDGWMND